MTLFKALQRQRDHAHNDLESTDDPRDFDRRLSYTLDGAITIDDGTAVLPRDHFGFTREDAYGFTFFDDHGRMKPDQYDHQDDVHFLERSPKWENITYAIAPFVILFAVRDYLSGDVSGVFATMLSIGVVIPWVIVKTLRVLARGYARSHVPEFIDIGRSAILSALMYRVLDVAVNDTDPLWDYYEDIMKTIQEYDCYRAENPESNPIHRDKEVLVLVAKIRRLEELIDDRGHDCRGPAPVMTRVDSSEISRGEYLDRTLRELGVIPTMTTTTTTTTPSQKPQNRS